jgi:hypothetical protein
MFSSSTEHKAARFATGQSYLAAVTTGTSPPWDAVLSGSSAIKIHLDFLNINGVYEIGIGISPFCDHVSALVFHLFQPPIFVMEVFWDFLGVSNEFFWVQTDCFMDFMVCCCYSNRFYATLWDFR